MAFSGKQGPAQDALGPVMEYIRSQLDASTGLFLDRAQKTLNDAWPQIHDFKKQDHTRYAASWLHGNRARIQTALHERLIGALQSAPPPAYVAPELGELRLMDAETLSAQLIRSRMVSRVMERGRNDLTALEARFEHLQKMGVSLNPRALGPGALADGFLDVLKELKVPAEVQALLLDVYGDQGVALLVEFYQGINRTMVERGIKPELEITNRRTFQHRGDSKPPEGGDARAQAVQQLLEQVSRGEWQPGLFRQLLDWQFAQSTGTTPGGAVPAGGAMPAPGGMPAGAPHSATQAIATSLAASGDPGVHVPGVPMAVTIDAIRDLAGLLSPTVFVDPRSMSPEQNRAVDRLESQSFELLRDERISPRVRSELSRLIPPLLSAQLSYPGTFGAPDNPPRVFVRQLALLGYRDQEFPLEDFDAVRVVVDRILAEEGREIDSFRSGAEVLYTLARREVKRRLAAMADKRAGKPPEHAAVEASAKAEDLARHEQDAFIAESRHQVAIELSDRAAGLELAPPVAEFIKLIVGPWMMSRYQKYGADSAQWKDARGFATRYFEAIQPAADENEQTHKEALRSRVVLEARLHAQRSQLPPAQREKLVLGLERYLAGLGIVPRDQRATSAARGTPIDFLRDLPRALA